MVCGATNPVTFTINNNNNTTGITGYTWNVGTVPNGWLYNGSAAPATIAVTSTTLSPLTLTPDCGKALSNVSAIVTANGNNYNTTNSSTVSITQPSFSISGSSSLCSGSGSYSVTGMPCNASVAWAAPPSNMANLSSLTASPTTMTYAGTSGSFTLSANVTACNITTPVTLPVHVGPYTSSNYSLSVNGVVSSNPLYWCSNQNYTFSVLGGSGSNYNWSVPSGWSILYNNGTPLALRSPSGTTPATGTVSVSFTEPCGTIVTLNKTVAYSNNGCSGSSIYSVSPNPASTNITIACISLQTYCNIAAVQITDINGTVMSSQSWSYTNQQVQMPVYFLQNGTYIARIYSGTQWYSVTFFVQH
ncbi:MAG: T9SS type A sorting domain-containing protein [Sphingobacteriales bacterium]|nr:T9SS type A sorting domain-containing protein [Sphingobacteriales bacterium]MBI3717203.1 T9SS type A sorting domain-containing protein [Sphingobacteriales bacterium]